jgi:hypothetical protein
MLISTCTCIRLSSSPPLSLSLSSFQNTQELREIRAANLRHVQQDFQHIAKGRRRRRKKLNTIDRSLSLTFFSLPTTAIASGCGRSLSVRLRLSEPPICSALLLASLLLARVARGRAAIVMVWRCSAWWCSFPALSKKKTRYLGFHRIYIPLARTNQREMCILFREQRRRFQNPFFFLLFRGEAIDTKLVNARCVGAGIR